MKAKEYVLVWNGGGFRRSIAVDRPQFAVHVDGRLCWTPFLKKPEHNHSAIAAERFTRAEVKALGRRLTGQKNLMIGEV